MCNAMTSKVHSASGQAEWLAHGDGPGTRPGGCPATLRRPNLNSPILWRLFHHGMAQTQQRPDPNDQRPPQARQVPETHPHVASHLPKSQHPHVLQTTTASIMLHRTAYTEPQLENCTGTSAAEVKAFPANALRSGRAVIVVHIFGSATPSWNILCSTSLMRKLCPGLRHVFARCQQHQTAACT